LLHGLLVARGRNPAITALQCGFRTDDRGVALGGASCATLASIHMASEQAKGQTEVDVFLRFLELSQLKIDPDSIEKRSPPEPDILCTHQPEGQVAFELVEMCDRLLAKSIAEASDRYLRTSDPSPRIVSKKLRRKYQTGAPIELLCYTAGRIVTPDNVILPAIEPYLKSWRNVFRRAWLLGRKGLYVVWNAG